MQGKKMGEKTFGGPFAELLLIACSGTPHPALGRPVLSALWAPLLGSAWDACAWACVSSVVIKCISTLPVIVSKAVG